MGVGVGVYSPIMSDFFVMVEQLMCLCQGINVKDVQTIRGRLPSWLQASEQDAHFIIVFLET